MRIRTRFFTMERRERKRERERAPKGGRLEEKEMRRSNAGLLPSTFEI